MGIRVVPNETVPAAVYRVLLPHERRVITVRFHPAILIRPVAETLGGLAVAGLISTLIHISSSVLLVVWLLWLILVIRLLFRIYQWLEDYFVNIRAAPSRHRGIQEDREHDAARQGHRHALRALADWPAIRFRYVHRRVGRTGSGTAQD